MKIILAITISMILQCFCMAQDINFSKLGNNPEVGKYADIRGFKMYYEIYGNGEPLLFIHGNGGSINNFAGQVSHFARRFKIILADSRAQGKSVDPSDSISYEMMTDDFDALLEYLKLDSCFVIGWSDGGIEALLLAMRHPDKVRKLAVTGANLWPDTSAVNSIMYRTSLHEYDSLRKLPSTPELKNKIKVYRLMPFEPHIKAGDLAKIKCPSLIIGGDHDIILPQHTLLIAQSIPNSYLWIIPNAGHLTPIFHRDDFNKVVMEFFIKPYRKPWFYN